MSTPLQYLTDKYTNTIPHARELALYSQQRAYTTICLQCVFLCILRCEKQCSNVPVILIPLSGVFSCNFVLSAVCNYIVHSVHSIVYSVYAVKSVQQVVCNAHAILERVQLLKLKSAVKHESTPECHASTLPDPALVACPLKNSQIGKYSQLVFPS